MTEKDAQVGVRMPAALKAALRRAAADDGRTLSALIVLVMTEWMRQQGKGKRK